MSKKIMGFDGWTKGVHHFARLLPALDTRGMSLVLVHLGSWGNDPGRPVEEQLQGVTVRDIAFYGSDSIERVLDIECPDAVVLLSTHHFARRALLRYCRQRAIPTLNLYHGLVDVQAADGGSSKKINKAAYARFVLSRLPRLFIRVFPCYLRALIRTSAPLSDWTGFVKESLMQALGKRSSRAPADALTTKCAVYCEADVEHAIRTFGFRRDDVRAVGNPDLMRFGLSESVAGSALPRGPRGGRARERTVVYINSGLLVQGRVFAGRSGRESFLKHIITMDRTLTSLGYRLLFKPHPCVGRELLDAIGRETNVAIVQNDELTQRLMECETCIVEATSLAIVPALIGVPLLLANFGELRDLRYGPVLANYPRAHLLTRLEDIDEIVSRDWDSLDAAAVREWVRVNAAPLPPERMPERVADVLAALTGAGCTADRRSRQRDSMPQCPVPAASHDSRVML